LISVGLALREVLLPERARGDEYFPNDKTSFFLLGSRLGGGARMMGVFSLAFEMAPNVFTGEKKDFSSLISNG